METSKNLRFMPLLITGNKFVRDLENVGALGLYVPLEGGFEGRYQRRLRGAGYPTLHLSAAGLGDLPAYLTGVHGVRPHHIGKSEIRTYFVPPIIDSYLANLPAKAKGLALWFINGGRLSRQELEFLALLPSLEPRVKVAIELGGDHTFRWQPLKDSLSG